jgi:hypothetical protein
MFGPGVMTIPSEMRAKAASMLKCGMGSLDDAGVDNTDVGIMFSLTGRVYATKPRNCAGQL